MIKNNYKNSNVDFNVDFSIKYIGKDILLQSTTSTKKILGFMPISYQYLKNKPE